jgi:hypothetical protein
LICPGYSKDTLPAMRALRVPLLAAVLVEK